MSHHNSTSHHIAAEIAVKSRRSIKISGGLGSLVLVKESLDGLLVVVRLLLVEPDQDLLLSVGDHLQQFLLPSVPLYLGPLPLIDLLPVALQLLLAAHNLIIEFTLSALLLMQLFLKGLVLGLQLLPLFYNAVDSLADALHLFLQTGGLLFLSEGSLQLILEAFEFLLLAGPRGLDEVEQELRTIGGILFFQLKEGLVVVDRHFYFLLEEPDLALHLL